MKLNNILNSSLKYGFVVLNYNNYIDAVACANSILKITHRDDYLIVIVDNASPNNSFNELKREFEGHPKIVLLLNENNTGYSGGNNVGIRALMDIGISQIIIATNDTEVLSTNILDRFDEINSSDVGIVGTDVVTPEGVHQNPPLYRPTLLYFLNLYLYAPMAWLRAHLYKRFPILERKRKSSVSNEIDILSGTQSTMLVHQVYMLHGCFLYLTKNYIDKIGLLDENLFMYGEEDLMSWNCETSRLKRLYLPSIKVLHKDGMSTKGVYKEGKEEFVRAMTLKSKTYLATKIGRWDLFVVAMRGMYK